MSNYIDKIQTENGNLYDIKSKVTSAIQGNNTVISTDKVPYVMRPSKSISTIDIKNIVIDGWTATRSTILPNGKELTVTPSAADSYVRSNVTTISGHKYFLSVQNMSSVAIRVLFLAVSSVSANSSFSTVLNYSNMYNTFVDVRLSDSTSTSTYKIKDLCVVDLTEMYGATTADYIYSLESASAGTGVAKLNEMGFFSESYTSPYIRETLVGGTIGWNQFVKNGNFADITGWSTYAGSLSASNNVLTETKVSGTASNSIGIYRSDVTTYVANHKYFVTCDMKSSAALSNYIYLAVSNQSVPVKGGTLTTSWNTFYNIFNLSNVANNYINLFITGMSSYTSELILNYKNFMLVDLTIMLGTTIADYIYNLETATAGAGVAKLREWGFFTKVYYPYNAGSVLSVQTTGHKVVGFNQWDEQWEVGGLYWDNGQPADSTTRFRSKYYCDMIGGANYYKRNGSEVYVFMYDSNKVLINYVYEQSFTAPLNAKYFKILHTTSASYSNDICINISDSTKNGTYEPYKTNTYTTDNIIMRGIPKLDANNLLYYDGDVYESNGRATIKYGYVDMGSLSWTSGTAGGFYANISGLKEGLCGLRTARYRYDENTNFAWANFSTLSDKTIYRNNGSGNYTIYVKDMTYSDAASFTTAVSGNELVYELNTPYEETWHSFDNPQYVYPGGTEEYIDTRETPVPVGHITEYMGANDEKFYAPSNPIDDEKYVLTNKSGSVFWSRESKWISLKNGSYDEGSMSRKLTLPSNWTNVKIALEYHALHLGSTSEIIQTEVTRDIYEEGHYMSGGICTVSFGLYGTLSCRIILGEYTNSSNETVHYIEMDDVKGDEGVTVISDFHFWIYYTI